MSRTGPIVGVLGIPFDANSSFRRGPARAPAAIRRAMSSEAGNPWSERGVRVWQDERIVDHGDLKVAPRLTKPVTHVLPMADGSGRIAAWNSAAEKLA